MSQETLRSNGISNTEFILCYPARLGRVRRRSLFRNKCRYTVSGMNDTVENAYPSPPGRRRLRVSRNAWLAVRLYLLFMAAATVGEHEINPGNPDWYSAFLWALIFVTPIAVAVVVSFRISARLNLSLAAQIFALWLAFVAGYLVYVAVFPFVVIGGVWDFLGAIPFILELLVICVISVIVKVYIPQMRRRRQMKRAEEEWQRRTPLISRSEDGNGDRD